MKNKHPGANYEATGGGHRCSTSGHQWTFFQKDEL